MKGRDVEAVAVCRLLAESSRELLRKKESLGFVAELERAVLTTQSLVWDQAAALLGDDSAETFVVTKRGIRPEDIQIPRRSK